MCAGAVSQSLEHLRCAMRSPEPRPEWKSVAATPRAPRSDEHTEQGGSDRSGSRGGYDLLKINKYYLMGRKVKTLSKDKTRFWEDSWMYEISPELYEICDNKEIFVNQVRVKNWQMHFRRWLYMDLRLKWENIHKMAVEFKFQNEPNKIECKWGKEKTDTIKTFYTHIANHNHKYGAHMKHVWKAKIHTKSECSSGSLK